MQLKCQCSSVKCESKEAKRVTFWQKDDITKNMSSERRESEKKGKLTVQPVEHKVETITGQRCVQMYKHTYKKCISPEQSRPTWTRKKLDCQWAKHFTGRKWVRASLESSFLCINCCCWKSINPPVSLFSYFSKSQSHINTIFYALESISENWECFAHTLGHHPSLAGSFELSDEQEESTETSICYSLASALCGVHFVFFPFPSEEEDNRWRK